LKHNYLDSPSQFKIFAHRGFIYSGNEIVRDENTLGAFRAAIEAGADYLELDVQSSSDGIAVVFHDELLDRVSGRVGPINKLTWTEIQGVALNFGEHIPRFEDVLVKFPTVRINVDIKSAQAISDLANSIQRHGAQERVLLTSFNESRRRAGVLAAPGVATSPSAWLMLRIRLSHLLGLRLGRLLKSVNVLQIPVSYGILRLDSPKFIESVKQHGVEVVYWTINDPSEARRLRRNGANGIVTDRTDVMVSQLNLK